MLGVFFFAVKLPIYQLFLVVFGWQHLFWFAEGQAEKHQRGEWKLEAGGYFRATVDGRNPAPPGMYETL